jgi:hypothetical protein
MVGGASAFGLGQVLEPLTGALNKAAIPSSILSKTGGFVQKEPTIGTKVLATMLKVAVRNGVTEVTGTVANDVAGAAARRSVATVLSVFHKAKKASDAVQSGANQPKDTISLVFH